MTKILSLRQTPGELQSAPWDQFDKAEQTQAELLELRSETGSLYVRPSRWQRFRLRWAFRHFRKLPPELLSRRDQRLIEKLSRSAVATPAFPIAAGRVFGVVEKVHSTKPACGLHLVRQHTGLSAIASTAPSGATEWPGVAARVREPESRSSLPPLVPWGALGTLAAIGLVVVLASVDRVPRFSSTDPGPGLLPAAHSFASPAPGLSPAVTPGPQRWVAPLPPETTLVRQELAAFSDRPRQVNSKADTTGRSGNAAGITNPQAPTVDAGERTSDPVVLAPPFATERGFVSELPQGPFARPVVSQRNMVGELQLRALIGADGSVKQVTVVSGDRRLAEAGMRAVRQWHYRPHPVTGSAAEMETHIKMSFFGEDAVSIASIAN